MPDEYTLKLSRFIFKNWKRENNLNYPEYLKKFFTDWDGRKLTE